MVGVSTLFTALIGLSIVNVIIGGVDLYLFSSRHPSISSAGDLDDFRKLARKQMYQALLAMVILGTAMLVGLWGIWNGQLSLMYTTVLYLVGLAPALACKKFEVRAQSLEVNGKELATQYQSICSSWMEKAFPDF